ncbi:hypothetical protein ACFQHO_43390 [Actinomadura yumaensis]|uniref:hypothetical protein n=1 Tax=Actinomadura yumaensis TaxID=111807 RepID=UPI00362317B8
MRLQPARALHGPLLARRRRVRHAGRGRQHPGATRYGGNWYLSQSRGKSDASALIKAVQPGGATGALRGVAPGHYGGIGTEDLSYWPGSDAHRSGLWTLTEHWGKRMVYVTPKP